MKLLKNKKIDSKRLFELQIIKSKIYTQFINVPFLKQSKNDLSNIVFNFKKSLNIIFKYHKNNKRILFIGSPSIIENFINSKTVHISIPNYMYIENNLITNGYIYNSIKLSKHMFTNKKFFLSKIEKRPELIIIFNHTKRQSIVKEATIAKIPLIEYNYNQQKIDYNSNYNVPGSMQLNKNKIIDNIFFVILTSLFSSRKNIIKNKC